LSLSQEEYLPTHTLQLLTGMVLGLLVAWLYFLAWKTRYTGMIREDAVLRSRAVTAAKVYEQLTPYLPGFPYNPQDVRFLGGPVDLVIFDGLADGHVRRIVFAEIKAGGAVLSRRERGVRDAVESGEVEWAELRVTSSLAGGPA
jgi:predicted Holliday junction resolvase-like endonuclease